ncbi:FliI/YscN family ATPase [Marinomonas mediterranea]|jgi:ATPase FliI/YscN family|uniref:protein-secreting ATPase n=1 Tax=Marinomonas mediterranea (strain ATCC 700492 / JCM 21426 / NBRC 103028 / MMB-1) TaxID=717774 RepID=F2JTD3_MARM1|nr:FliI/YscN family ATPase [Marinomonas mediterranea]ADZ90351.1 ATPase, FliI/YscN family [Marinomonas mediterranea MMB-1]
MLNSHNMTQQSNDDTRHSDIKQRLKNWSSERLQTVQDEPIVKVIGRVTKINGILVESRIADARIGDLCTIQGRGNHRVLAEIIGFSSDIVLLSALGALEGISVGASIMPHYQAHCIDSDESLLGSVLDGFGRLLQGKRDAFTLEESEHTSKVIRDAIAPTQRPRISAPMPTGVRAIDGLLTIGEGQRIGVFAGAGCGKTTLLAELARNMPCDVIVFGLIGERGRELREFLDHELDEELRSRSVLVCSTSDRTSMERARAASTATAIAEGFRAQGKRVLLLIDSLTRFARAQREIGLAAGEPPGRGGFPPSVYTMLPRLVERAGNMEGAGSITALYTVLIEGDVIAGDPVADEVRSLLDGHIILSRKLAEKNHYPAIDVLGSISRTMPNVTDPNHIQSAAVLRNLMSAYKEVEMLIRLGEYEQGNDPLTDTAVALNGTILEFLQQSMRSPSSIQDTLHALSSISQHAAT